MAKDIQGHVQEEEHSCSGVNKGTLYFKSFRKYFRKHLLKVNMLFFSVFTPKSLNDKFEILRYLLLEVLL